MEYACGTVAGEYARRFWATRKAADEAAVPFTAPTAGQLRRHEEKFMPRERKHQASHREAVVEVADAYGVNLDERDDPVGLAKSRPRRGGRATALLASRKTANLVEGGEG